MNDFLVIAMLPGMVEPAHTLGTHGSRAGESERGSGEPGEGCGGTSKLFRGQGGDCGDQELLLDCSFRRVI